jgi:hypothetical protein
LTETVEKGLKKIDVTVSKPVLALIATIFGLLVIALPDPARMDRRVVPDNSGSSTFHGLYGIKETIAAIIVVGIIFIILKKPKKLLALARYPRSS